MGKESSQMRAKQTRNKDTSRGIYTKIRSKFLKDKNGYGEPVTLAREKAMEANGGPLPKGSAVHHTAGSVAGAKNKEDDNHWAVTTKGENTSESNMRRGGRSRAYIRKKLGKSV